MYCIKKRKWLNLLQILLITSQQYHVLVTWAELASKACAGNVMTIFQHAFHLNGYKSLLSITIGY